MYTQTKCSSYLYISVLESNFTYYRYGNLNYRAYILFVRLRCGVPSLRKACLLVVWDEWKNGMQMSASNMGNIMHLARRGQLATGSNKHHFVRCGRSCPSTRHSYQDQSIISYWLPVASMHTLVDNFLST